MVDEAQTPSHRIFICYRRKDTGDEAPQLRTMLNAKLGDDTAFLDERDVEGGTDWPTELRERLLRAELVIVLVGADWLTATTDKGRRRLEVSNDWVRREIETALAEGKKILPLTLHDAELPDRDALPDSLQPLCEKQSRVLDIRTAEPVIDLVKQLLEADRPDPNDPLPTYRTNLRACHSKLVSFFPDCGDALLTEVFVELELDPLLDRSERYRTRAKDVDLLHAGQPTRIEELLNQPIGPHNPGRFVLLGEPGAGKSTLLRHLTHQRADPAKPDLPLPVFIPLANWSASHSHALDAADPGSQPHRHRDALRARIEHLAGRDGEDGSVWIFLDGLDEVAPDKLGSLRQRIDALVAQLPKARFVVTTRAIGYRSLGADWQHARLRPLPPARQRELLGRWLPADRADELHATTSRHPEISRLAGNPLLLTLLATLIAESPDAQIPTTRTGLYRGAIEQLLRKEYGTPKQAIDHPFEARRILQRLALALQENDEVAWPEDTLLELLDTLRASEPALARWLGLWPDTGTFLDQCAKRTNILAPHDGTGAPWKFLHRQFREYLAAKELANDRGDWEPLLQRLTDDNLPRWSETIGLVCGLSDEPAKLLRGLMAKNPAAAVRALGEIEGVPPAELLDLLDSIPTDPTSSQPAWQGDDLREAVDGWLRRGLATEEELRKLLFQRLRPITDRGSRIRAAWIHFALSVLGPVDPQPFFEACGLPLPSEDSTEFVAIPAGRFEMGSPEDEVERYGNEGPVHEVGVPSFELSRCAVTNAAYARFDRSHEPETFGGKVKRREIGAHPVVNVSWWEAWLYCTWLGARLPTEAEWEYACRAGTTGPFSFDGALTPKRVNYDGNFPYARGPRGEYRQRTLAVGDLPANPRGLHEMHGNVWEWCEDRMHANYEGAPEDGSAWIAGIDRRRVLRGGSWIDHGRDCRSALRLADLPGLADRGGGFRPARSSH